jgi:rhodanese-related sulfurtransferase
MAQRGAKHRFLKLNSFIVFFLFCSGSFAGCGRAGLGACPRKMPPQEAMDIMKSGEPFILIDCRTESEFVEEHIEGAVSIPDYEIGARAAAALPDKDALILVYCSSGRLSADVRQELAAMGYTNVHDIGGIINWPYDTVCG